VEDLCYVICCIEERAPAPAGVVVSGVRVVVDECAIGLTLANRL
jgi:hypothetical protein